ncbi:glycosyltransferase family 1 protein [Burkholderia cenocepacia]|uniref:glycosyltransferase family 4 protein n=1 Tax=Burkholderia cenocepacia TaxID=95486 RepID=UPI00209D7BF9|nr:glycosyltransferase family 1 protein [Burkholderia cenocepacia]MCO8322935.1 glycosyltransferase family 4 protein [Burkholderia cenocepacia]MCO8330443.1 glycosyltransferase family 4 protein [Burkholderia cenocepacia]MCO8337728.1 glycosyltransferase family 4 protein [Burkholderia cenocepacia]MCO8344790.1 glycosyltransferase family 4 protein [Burkholderia cenocepacia]MCO8358073.1 glycosyltransferase family 4 protein [Burkholderia cenocepacia]
MSSKTILIDGFNLALPDGTGIATYARNLSFAAHELGWRVGILYGMNGLPANPLLKELMFYSNVPHKSRKIKLKDRVRTFISGRVKPKFAERLDFSGKVITKGQEDRAPYCDFRLNADALFDEAAKNYDVDGRFQTVHTAVPVDIAHFTYPVPVTVNGAVNICTIHDLVPLILPNASLGNKERFIGLLSDIVARYDHIVTVSETSRKDIIDILGVPPDKVTNTWQSVVGEWNDETVDLEAVRQEVGNICGVEPRKYHLFFGAIEPKKNVLRLLDAYALSGSSYPLVVVGKEGWSCEKEMAVFESFNQVPRANGTRIVRLGHVPRALLTSLIKGARSVLFPSLYEGFGLPVLEAMSVGTPVLTSTEGSLPEVAGDAALLVDPYDIRAIAEGIRALDVRDDLREQLTEKGMVRARYFSGDEYCRRLASLYDGLTN